MNTTPELLDAARAKLGLTSDYQLAKALGWPFSTVSSYRTEQRAMHVEQVADFHAKTGIPLEIVVKVAVDDGRRLRAKKKGLPLQPSLKLGNAA